MCSQKLLSERPALQKIDLRTPAMSVASAGGERKRDRKAYYKQRVVFMKLYQKTHSSITRLMANADRMLAFMMDK